MEVEQLLSWVRYERSRLAGFTALDEILTIVNEAKDRVAEAEKQVQAYETKLEGLKAFESESLANHQAQVEALYAEMTRRKAEADANHDKALSERKDALAKLDASITDRLAFYDALCVDVQFAEKQMVDISHRKVELESDVAALRKQLQDIKDSIQ